MSEWPVVKALGKGKETALAKLFFDTGAVVDMQRIERVAGNRENAVKYVSVIRNKLAAGYDIVRNGTGYQLSYPPPTKEPEMIKAEDVSVEIAISVINQQFETQVERLRAEITAINEQLQTLNARKEKLKNALQIVEAGQLAMMQVFYSDGQMG